MSSIDQRVVEMKFNNAQFASGIQSTVSMLDRLKKSLNLDGAAKSLKGLDSASKGFSLAHMTSGVDALASRFSALSVVGVTALATIANKAVNAGLQMAKSFTIDPIKQGFSEYETNMNSIQTILANTQRFGTKLPEVTRNLDELNSYADKTIYNFGDMVKNIGLFTNAGIKVGDATSMIKGFSNAAAASGTSAEGAAGAAYQLSQGLSAGKITLMDWKSLTNVGMGNKNMQTSIIEIASAMGTFKGKGTSASEAQKSFNTTLEKGWLTADVMSNYLKIMGGDMDKTKMKSLGLSDSVIKDMLAQQKTAQDAATKVRTLTALIGTMREAVGSGWSSTFKLLFGDFNEATTLFTNVNSVFSGMIGASADARNKVLGDWKKLGGRSLAIDAISNGFKALMSVITAIRGAFRDIFPAATGKQLYDITKAIDDFSKKLIMSKSTAENFKRTFAGVFAIFSIASQVIKAAVGAIAGALSPFFNNLDLASGGILAITGNAGDWIVALDEAMKKTGWFANTFAKVSSAVKPVGNLIASSADKVKVLAAALSGPARAALVQITTKVESFHSAINKLVSGGLSVAQQKFAAFAAVVSSTVSNVSDAIKSFGKGATSGAASGVQKGLTPLKALGGGILEVWSRVEALFVTIGDRLSSMGSAASNALSSVKSGIKAMVSQIDPNVSLGTLNLGIFAAVAVMIKRLFAAATGTLKGSLMGSLDQLTGTLKAMQTSLKAEALLKLAAAIAVLAGAVMILSLVDPERLMPAVAAMSAMLLEMLASMAILDKITSSSGFIKMPFLSLSLILLGAALVLFATAAKKFAKLSWEELARGLLGVSAVLAATNLAKGGKVDAVALLLLAFAVNAISDALVKMAALSWEELGKGASVMAVLLGLTTAFGAIKFDAAKVVVAAAGILILSVALSAMSETIKLLSGIDWSVYGDGLAKLALSLGLIGVTMSMMPPNMLASAAAITILSFGITLLAGALKVLSMLSWGEFGKSMVVLGVSMAILAAAMYAMEGGLPGAAALVVIAFGLGLLVPVLITLGNLEWETIGKGLAAIGGALLVIAIGGLALTPVVPILLGFSLAMGILGLASLAAGAGLMLMGVGLTAIAVSGAIAIPIFVNLMKTLIDMIPVLLKRIGEGLVAFAQVIIASAPVIVGAFTAILLALIVSLEAVVPKLITLILNVLASLLTQLANNMPRFVEAGVKILISLLTGIRNNIQQFVTLALQILTAFMNGLSAGIPGLIQAGMNLMVTFIESLAAGVRANSERMNAAGRSLLGAIISGMISGVTGGIGAIVAAATSLASRLLNAVKSFLGISSPSTVFLGVGRNVVLGLVNGVIGAIGSVISAATRMGSSLITSARNTISNGIGSVVNAAKSLVSRVGQGIASGVTTVASAARNVASSAIRTLSGGISNGIGTVVSTARNFVSRVAQGVASGASSAASAARNVASSGVHALSGGLSSGAGTVASAARNMVSRVGGAISSGAGAAASAARGVASSIISGLANGISNGIGSVTSAARGIASSALSAAKSALGINSPSKAFANLGMGVAEGLSLGIDNFSKLAANASANMASGAIDATKSVLEINSPSKAFTKLGEYTSQGFAKGLIGSSSTVKSALDNMRALIKASISETAATITSQQERLKRLQASNSAKIAAIKRAQVSLSSAQRQKRPNKDTVARAKLALGQAVNNKRLNDAAIRASRTLISQNQVLHNRSVEAYSTLGTDLKKQQATLGYLGKQYDVVTAKLTTAKTALDDAKKAQTEAAASFTTQYSVLPELSGKTKLSSYMAAIKKETIATDKFKLTLDKLRTLGMDDTTYKKLLAEGIGAQPFLDQLLASGATGIGQLNTLNKNLATSAGKLGSKAAGDLYFAGVKAAQGLVSGLMASQKKVESQMASIARAMVLAIKRELRIKSPSKALMEVGKYTNQGLAGGLDQYSHLVKNSATNVGHEAINAMKKSISGISELVTNEIDVTPAIRPVLDLSLVKKDASLIGGLLGMPSLALDGAYDKAASVAAGYSTAPAVNAPPESSGFARGERISFVQNNNSPKALSNAEIYRQTKNQLSVVKGALTA